MRLNLLKLLPVIVAFLCYTNAVQASPDTDGYNFKYSLGAGTYGTKLDSASDWDSSTSGFIAIRTNGPDDRYFISIHAIFGDSAERIYTTDPQKVAIIDGQIGMNMNAGIGFSAGRYSYSSLDGQGQDMVQNSFMMASEMINMEPFSYSDGAEIHLKVHGSLDLLAGAGKADSDGADVSYSDRLTEYHAELNWHGQKGFNLKGRYLAVRDSDLDIFGVGTNYRFGQWGFGAAYEHQDYAGIKSDEYQVSSSYTYKQQLEVAARFETDDDSNKSYTVHGGYIFPSIKTLKVLVEYSKQSDGGKWTLAGLQYIMQ